MTKAQRNNRKIGENCRKKYIRIVCMCVFRSHIIDNTRWKYLLKHHCSLANYLIKKSDVKSLVHLDSGINRGTWNRNSLQNSIKKADDFGKK